MPRRQRGRQRRVVRSDQRERPEELRQVVRQPLQPQDAVERPRREFQKPHLAKHVVPEAPGALLGPRGGERVAFSEQELHEALEGRRLVGVGVVEGPMVSAPVPHRAVAAEEAVERLANDGEAPRDLELFVPLVLRVQRPEPGLHRRRAAFWDLVVPDRRAVARVDEAPVRRAARALVRGPRRRRAAPRDAVLGRDDGAVAARAVELATSLLRSRVRVQRVLGSGDGAQEDGSPQQQQHFFACTG
mmetsp:Transcript_32577/g.98062  ORF Transcript_32577/g.98062 Transcript_32577/m.98062 type:complete len:245 (-) Transcript_32577:60-794(-)